MRSASILWIAFVAAAAPVPARAAGETCATLDACLARLSAVAILPGDYAHSRTPGEDRLIKHLVRFDGAVARLVPLLKDPDERIAQIAAAALRDAKVIDPAYLPEIRVGLDRGLAWLPAALGRIPSAEAAREAVARFLVSKSAPGNQEAYAIQLSGLRAVPYILAAAQCRSGCPPEAASNLAAVLRRMDARSRQAAGQGLLRIAREPGVPQATALGALTMIEALGRAGRYLEGGLVELRRQRPDLGAGIDAALIGIGAENAAPILARRLELRPAGFEAILTLGEVARLGEAGRSAGPAVLGRLEDSDWDTRLGAARALGYIDYQPAVPALIAALENPDDVRLNWVAAGSLGRLGNPAAREALERAAARHWYPPVRQAAATALESLAAVARGASRTAPHADFFAYEYLGATAPACDRPSIGTIAEPPGRKLYWRPDAARLAALACAAEPGAAAPAAATAGDKAKREATCGARNVETMDAHSRAAEHAPHVALRTARGWLAGGDRGEFGGELQFLGDDHSRQLILNENVADIFSLGTRTLALTGLAHMTFNHGMIYELTESADGAWSAVRWRSLPGAPAAAWLTDTNELLIKVLGGGTLVLSADGALRMAACRARAPR